MAKRANKAGSAILTRRLLRLTQNAIECRFDSPDRRAPVIDGVDLPARGLRRPLNHHDARRLVGTDPHAGMREQRGHRDSDDPGANHTIFRTDHETAALSTIVKGISVPGKSEPRD